MFNRNILLSSIFGFALVASMLVGPIKAEAASISLYPGQTGKFSITYTNGGDADLMQNALLNVLVGSELVIDSSTFTDNFNEAGTFKVNPNIIISNNETNGTTLKYRPGTATAANTGSNTAGDVSLPPDKSGVLEFRATLKADSLSSSRVTLNQTYNYVIDKQGVYSILNFSGNGSVPGSVDLRVVADPSPVIPPVASYTVGVVVSPSPSVVSQSVNVKGTVLRNGAGTSDMNGASCTVRLTNASGFTATVNGTVNSGICEGSFTGPNVPPQPGQYVATVVVNQQNNLGPFTGQAPFQVIAGAATPPTVLPRTGGLEIAVVVALIGVGGSVGTYYYTRRNRLKINK